MHDVISMVSGILMMILILLMAYGASRFLGKNFRALGRGRYMEVVDHVSLGQDKELLILHLKQEGKCLLLGSGSEGFRLLSELSGEYPVESPGQVLKKMPEGSFPEVFKQWVSKEKKEENHE